MFKLLGITDEITTCDCCGKSNLKFTVGFENEVGEVVHYGRDCAGAALYGRKSAKNTANAERRAREVQSCRDALPRVLAAIAEGATVEAVNKMLTYPLSVSFGTYADTGNKKPLRIYGLSSIPGVELSPAEY